MAQIDLSGVAETAMWTLYTRANEAQRSDGVLKDPRCIELFESIDYPYESKFGKDQTGLHGEKSRIFDAVVRQWLAENPSGTIVELGAGLETQFHRLDNGTVSWICLDLDEVIAVREKFLAPTERCRYIAADACDVSWFEQVGPGPVLITAQSFLMFLHEEQARHLLVAIIDRFPGVEIVFDTISPAISQKNGQGLQADRKLRVSRCAMGYQVGRHRPVTTAMAYRYFQRRGPEFRGRPRSLECHQAAVPADSRAARHVAGGGASESVRQIVPSSGGELCYRIIEKRWLSVGFRKPACWAAAKNGKERYARSVFRVSNMGLPDFAGIDRSGA